MQYKIIFFLLYINIFYSEHSELWDNPIIYEYDVGWTVDIGKYNYKQNGEEQHRVCTTNECKIIGREFLKGINRSVNPCDNFYDFVCGAYESNYKIPGYTPVWSRTKMFQQTVYHRIKGILEMKTLRQDILPVRQVKKWYRACVDLDALDKYGIRPLESILMQLGGWPMTIDHGEWNENRESWQNIEQHYFNLIGSYIFYDIQMHPILGIMTHAGELPLSKKLPSTSRNYSGNTYNDYAKLIKNVVQIFVNYSDANITVQMITEDIEDMIKFEKELYKISKEYTPEDAELVVDDFIEQYNDYIDANITTKITRLNFRKLLGSYFDMINFEFNGTMLMDSSVYYFVQLTELLNKTPKRTIVNYLHWHFVSDMLVHTTENMRNILFQYMEHKYGITEREPRWLECMKEVKMNIAKSYAFVQKYFSDDTARAANDMFINVREEMKSQISSSSWLDRQTKDIAIDKLENINLFLGFPEWLKNKTTVISTYRTLHIGDNHFENVLNYKYYEIRRQWLDAMKRKTLYDPTEMNPIEVNAYYMWMENNIMLPAAGFQSPLFTLHLPSVINYGSVGCIIGHEIGHAYDITGIEYGKKGEFVELPKQIMDMYYKRAECFLRQFNNYYGVTESDYDDTTPYYRDGSRGRKTRGENMADTTGLHSVVEAYKKMRAKNPNVVCKLPGFENYTDDQMFFISFGAMWCQISRPEYAKVELKDVHSPPRLRVIGAVSNSDDFAQAFNCPKGSPMNPENKCNVWESIENKMSVKSKVKLPESLGL